MEDGVHILLLVEAIEYGTGDIADTFGDDPDDGCGRDGVYQRLEGHEHTQSHPHKAEGLKV